MSLALASLSSASALESLCVHVVSASAAARSAFSRTSRASRRSVSSSSLFRFRALLCSIVLTRTSSACACRRSAAVRSAAACALATRSRCWRTSSFAARRSVSACSKLLRHVSPTAAQWASASSSARLTLRRARSSSESRWLSASECSVCIRANSATWAWRRSASWRSLSPWARSALSCSRFCSSRAAFASRSTSTSRCCQTSSASRCCRSNSWRSRRATLLRRSISASRCATSSAYSDPLRCISIACALRISAVTPRLSARALAAASRSRASSSCAILWAPSTSENLRRQTSSVSMRWRSDSSCACRACSRAWSISESRCASSSRCDHSIFANSVLWACRSSPTILSASPWTFPATSRSCARSCCTADKSAEILAMASRSLPSSSLAAFSSPVAVSTLRFQPSASERRRSKSSTSWPICRFTRSTSASRCPRASVCKASKQRISSA
mmetsp:Transcript_41137/g.106386  ORF Transcript_41137/g.106386 Transcript_41137/m.106386 type:complete len:447 (+) Transcript_41137:1513-2853(+)